MNRIFLFVLVLFALAGWVLTGFFYGEASSLREDCAGLFPAIEDTIDYYDRVCAEGIEEDRLIRLANKMQDKNILIKGGIK